MAKQLIDVGVNLNDGTGDNLRTAGEKINSMMNEVYSTFGNGTILTATINGLQHVQDDGSPALGGLLDLNGFGIDGVGEIFSRIAARGHSVVEREGDPLSRRRRRRRRLRARSARVALTSTPPDDVEIFASCTTAVVLPCMVLSDVVTAPDKLIEKPPDPPAATAAASPAGPDPTTSTSVSCTTSIWRAGSVIVGRVTTTPSCVTRW